MRLRREPELDPDMRRELDVLDAALAGRAVDPSDQDLAELALALRSERPAPRPEFALDLDLRARDGFPAPEPVRPAPAPRRAAAFRRRWALALGTAASLFIVVTAVLVSGLPGGGGRDDSTSLPTELEDQFAAPAQRESAPAPAGTAAPAMSLPAPPDAAPRVRNRRVERGASITLAPPRDRIEDVADDALRVTDRHGGFVLSSNVTAGEGREAGANLELRIPSDRLQAAITDLSELAHVRARTQSSRDITAAFTSPRRQLADALAERRGLLRRLAAADTPNETAAVRARLRAVNRRIDRAQRDLRRLRERVSYAAVAVAIEPGTDKAEDRGGWTLGDAAADALGVLRALLGTTLVALAALVPAALVGALGWLAYRAWVRRRRESALDF